MQLSDIRDGMYDINRQLRNLKGELGRLALQVHDQGLFLGTLSREREERLVRKERREARARVRDRQLAYRTGRRGSGKGMALMTCHPRRKVEEDVESSSLCSSDTDCTNSL